MKKIILALALISSTVGIYSFTTKAGGDKYTANTTTSKVDFTGSKKDGYHTGNFALKSGEVTVEAGKLTGGKFVIDLSSLKVTDGAGEKLEGHLKSPDFFDLGKNSEASFSISNVKYVTENKVDIDGILTLKGVTAPIKFTAVVRDASEKFFAEASFSLDRTAFGLGYGAPKIASDVQINVHLFATK